MTAATIVALASGRPPSAVAIIRISGAEAWPVVAALLHGPLPTPRRLSLRQLFTPNGDAALDTAMVVVFPAPDTATGEALAELHLHGGPAVVEDVLTALTAQPGVRLANPGEFTRRAFDNGRLDLAQVEGLADLIAAETSSQRTQALALTVGTLSQFADEWREQIIAVLAEAEAGLDFAEDEADVAERIAEANSDKLTEIATILREQIADAGRAARIRDGLTIVVTGRPNVGKSSLVNALTMRSAAIVTSVPGTTRDLIEVPLSLDGIAAVMIDTAGLRDTDDPIEREGIRRARARANDADLVLHVVDSDETPVSDKTAWIVRNKSDLGESTLQVAYQVSALHGHGIASLREALAQWARTTVRPGEPALLTNARHRAAFVDAATAVEHAAATSDLVLRAEGLRSASQALGRIAGRVDVDDILDVIFSQFCIGK
jgi:tRNA modification GTPase